MKGEAINTLSQEFISVSLVSGKDVIGFSKLYTTQKCSVHKNKPVVE